MNFGTLRSHCHHSSNSKLKNVIKRLCKINAYYPQNLCAVKKARTFICQEDGGANLVCAFNN